MKRILYISLCVVLVLCLSSCGMEQTTTKEHYGDYYDGYVDGYSDGVYEGQYWLGGYAAESFSNACGIVYGIEEALVVLTLYADGEPFSEDEIFSAIQTVNSCYEKICDVIHDVENYYKY